LGARTGRSLKQPSAPEPPPDPKLLAVQARAQVDAALAAHQAQNDAIHLQVKTQGEIELAKIKAALDAKMSVLETHLKAAIETEKVPRSYPPAARWSRDDYHYVPGSNGLGKFLGDSSWLIIPWCRSSISRTSRMLRSFRSTTIRSATAARFSRCRLNLSRRRPNRNGLNRRKPEGIYPTSVRRSSVMADNSPLERPSATKRPISPARSRTA